MVRLVLFLLGIFGLTAALHWLADRPGNVTLEWQGNIIETSLFRATILFALAVGLASVAWALVRHLWRSPAVIGSIVTRRRERRGLDAISTGMIAIGSGDRAQAMRAAVQARKSLPNEPLTHLLRAQAAQLQGDSTTARRIFEAMLSSPDTEQVGLRGLYLEATREGEHEAAAQFAARAMASNPKLEWSVLSLFDLQCKAQDWDGALETLATARRNGQVERAVADRRRAVLLTAKAAALEDSRADTAVVLAQEAHALAPDLVPAAAIAGRVLASRGQTPKAAKILQKTWKLAPHPDLATAYAYARPGDSPSDRLERARALAKSTPGEVEGAIAIAKTAIDAHDWTAARDALQPYLEKDLAHRVCMLMARIEGEGFRNTGKVREWLARAVHATRDHAWTADGTVAAQWAAVSPVSGRLDAYEWRVPVEILEKPAAALVQERMNEMVSLGVSTVPRPLAAGSSDDKPMRARDDVQTIEIAEPTKPVQSTPRMSPATAAKTSEATKPLDADAFISPRAPDDPGVRRLEPVGGDDRADPAATNRKH